MSEINPNLLDKIKTKLETEEYWYTKLRLEVSKIFFAVVASLYFFFYLATVWGLAPELMWQLTSASFALFVFAICIFIYDLLIYWFTIYTNRVSLFRIPIMVILTIIFLALVALNYGVKI